MKGVKAVGLLLVILLLTAVPASAAPDLPVGGLGRLTFNGKDRFCTAFVVRSRSTLVILRYYGLMEVWDNLLISAGHCWGDNLSFRPHLKQNKYDVQLVARSLRPLGFDILIGRFYSLVGFPVFRLAPEYKVAVGESLTVVGYGGGVLQSYVAPFLRYDLDGDLVVGRVGQFGFSGSPVLNLADEVVGVAYAMGVKDVLTCQLLGICIREPFFFAEPIANVLRLLRP